MKKQLMAGMMAASMALSLAACGGSAASSAAPAADSTSGAASTSTAASTSSDEQVTLRFAWWGGDERANATMEVINKFMEENPNIKIANISISIRTESTVTKSLSSPYSRICSRSS